VAHYTTPDQDLEEVQTALGLVEATVLSINENVRDRQNEERLKELSEEVWVSNGK
jgi:hypothetical protein